MSEPQEIDIRGIKITSIDTAQTLSYTMTGGSQGIILDYELLSTAPKQFKITSLGLGWTDGVDTFDTPLERIAQSQVVLASIEVPPDATTLEVNYKINLDDQAGNVGSIGLNGVDTEITSTGDLILNPTGSGDVLIKTATNTRLGISDTGDWTINGGVGTSGQVLTSGGIGVSPSWSTPAAGGATIDIQQTNTNATYYPTFVDSDGTGKILRADTASTPWSINPNTGVFNFANTLSVGTGSSSNNVYIGRSTGTNGTNITAVGQNARGANNGGVNGTAVGVNAGYNAMGDRAVCIGAFAGNSSTGVGAVCVGYNAGGSFSVPAGNIIIDADLATNITASGGTNRFFVNPIRNATQTTTLGYDATTKEITYYTPNPPNTTLIQTEDMIYYPELILNAGYPALAGIMGTEIPLAVYNYNGGTTETWNGGYNANLLSGSLQRLGCSLLYSGSPGYTQHTSINEYSFTQISKITWGFCCLGNNYPDGLPTLTTDATYVMGLAPTVDRASSLFAVNTTNSIFWCWNGSSYAPPITTKFSFIINGVSQYTLTTNTNMTGKWGRCGFTINYVSGNTAQVQGFFTDLSTGITETTGVYTITGGTGFVNPITSPNACSVYHSIYGTAPRWFLVDYVQVETPNLYQIGVGSTQITGR